MDIGTGQGQCWEPLGKMLCECRDKQAVHRFPGRLKRDIGLNPTSVIFKLWDPEKAVPIPDFSFFDDEVETQMLCLLLEGHSLQVDPSSLSSIFFPP